jgi:hypothetical protein
MVELKEGTPLDGLKLTDTPDGWPLAVRLTIKL